MITQRLKAELLMMGFEHWSREPVTLKAITLVERYEVMSGTEYALFVSNIETQWYNPPLVVSRVVVGVRTQRGYTGLQYFHTGEHEQIVAAVKKAWEDYL